MWAIHGTAISIIILDAGVGPRNRTAIKHAKEMITL